MEGWSLPARSGTAGRNCQGDERSEMGWEMLEWGQGGQNKVMMGVKGGQIRSASGWIQWQLPNPNPLLGPDLMVKGP